MRRLVLFLSALAATAALAAPASEAHACGGFFCNAATQSPIIQAGERVLFARHDGLVTMHIEVTYQGDPTQFGWILPVPDAPKDADGQPLPLDKAVAISSLALFPNLQAATDPIFSVQNTFASDGGSCAYTSTATQTFADAAVAADAGTSGHEGTVYVVESAKVGPYDAELIHATDADALFTWLGRNGYQQDPAARPLLATYIGKGYDFVGIRLQSGKTTGDLRPLAITLGEDAPCVPLRLTSIAATPDMPILVWVLGAGRAVPKNFIHARIDDLAMTYPGGGSYQAIVSQAIDTASGRAWVTEMAAPAAQFVGVLDPMRSLASEVTAAPDARELVRTLAPFTSDPDVLAVLRAEVPMPAGLRGFPWGNCWGCPGCEPTYCYETDAEHVTTEAEFYGAIAYWFDKADAIGLTVDADALRARLRAEVFAPREAIADLFAKASVLTRFFTTLDPKEMTRDPIFAFNPDLPMVDRQHTVQAVVHTGSDCSVWVDVTYPDGRTWRQSCGSSVFGCGSIGPVPGVDPLGWPEILDESGEPVQFSKTQVGEVDRLLDGAAAGVPSLPAGFTVIPAESPIQPVLPRSPGAKADDGCGSGGGDGAALGLVVAALAALARGLASGRGRAARRGKRTLPTSPGLL